MEDTFLSKEKCPHCKQRGGLVLRKFLNPNLKKHFKELRCTSCVTPSSIAMYACMACRKVLKNRKAIGDHERNNKGHENNVRDYKKPISEISIGNNSSVTMVEHYDNDQFPLTNDDGNSIADVTTDATENMTTTSTESPTEDVHQDWLSRLLSKKPNIGREVKCKEDLVKYAGFDENSSSPEYYWAEHQQTGMGFKSLIAGAWGVMDPAKITEGEVEFTLDLCTLLLRLTDDDQALFAKCMQAAVNSKEKERTVFQSTRCPDCKEDFDFYYTGKKKRKTVKPIIPNLPHPVPKTTPDGSHAYAKLEDVVAHLLAEGTPVEKFHFSAKICLHPEEYIPVDPPTVSTSKAALDLFMQLNLEQQEDGEFILNLWFKEWRDDFDPFGIKSSRNQVWGCTNTICPPSDERRGRNTFFMAIASKGDDHTVVEQIFAEAQNKLRTEGMTAYSGTLKRIIRVKLGKFIVNVDRPEKSSTFRICVHGSTYGTCFGMATNVDPNCTDNRLPSCTRCRKERVKKQLGLELDPTPNSKDDSKAFSSDSELSANIREAQPVPNPEKDPKKVIGERVAKFFADGQLYYGSIKGLKQKKQKDHPDIWRVEYDDGDREEYDLEEIKVLLDTFKKNPPSITLCPKVETTFPPSGPPCPSGNCSNWQLRDLTFKSPGEDWPVRYDRSPNAPKPPKWRDISGSMNPKNVRLVSVELKIEWLKQVIEFAHHNAKTQLPEGNKNQRYWTKAHLKAYLRACAFSNDLVDQLYDSAVSLGDEKFPFIPPTWFPNDALQRVHYAPMHTIFLGMVKAMIDIVNQWQSSLGLLATFGKQANKYLMDIQKLRYRQYFHACPFTTSKWGTGVWVSENYLFWARVQKFFCLLPALQKAGKTSDVIKAELRAVMRFAMASHACISRLMSSDTADPGLDDSIMTYMDAVFEISCVMDKAVGRKRASEELEGGFNDMSNRNDVGHGGGACSSNHKKARKRKKARRSASIEQEMQGIELDKPAEVNEQDEVDSNSAESPAITKKKKKSFFGRSEETKQPFTRSVFLGILMAGHYHRYFGPAVLHWEGGTDGEKAIGPAKGFMTIKRSNTDWQTISLRKLLQLQRLNSLREKHFGEKSSRAMEGTIRVYKDEDEVRQCVLRNLPISGMRDKDGIVWIACRPVGEKKAGSDRMYGRSAVKLLEVLFEDDEGELVGDMCWCSPINRTTGGKVFTLEKQQQLEDVVEEFVLMLPTLGDDTYRETKQDTWIYQNCYYVIGSKWSERVSGGNFIRSELHESLFGDWID